MGPGWEVSWNLLNADPCLVLLSEELKWLTGRAAVQATHARSSQVKAFTRRISPVNLQDKLSKRRYSFLSN